MNRRIGIAYYQLGEGAGAWVRVDTHDGERVSVHVTHDTDRSRIVIHWGSEYRASCEGCFTDVTHSVDRHNEHVSAHGQL